MVSYSLSRLPPFTLCKNSEHLKSLKSLLIVHGLIEQKHIFGQFLKLCFHLGAVDIAISTFSTSRKSSLFLQNFMIRCLCDHGMFEDVLSVYRDCQVSSCASGHFTFPFVIKACSVLGAFRTGKEIHCTVVRKGYEKNIVIQTALIHFYGKIGYLASARILIDRIPQPDLVSWNALIACYSLHALDHEVFEVFKHYYQVGLKPNLSTLASVIPVCSRLGRLDIGMSFHGLAIKSGYFVTDSLVPALISLYAGEVHLSSSRKLFDYVLEKNVTIWNAMISAYTQKQMYFEAFETFREMLHAQVQPNFFTLVSVIPSCEIGGMWCGDSLHAYVIKHGSENQISVLIAFLSFYAKLGKVSKAELLFEWMPSKNLLSWNVMVSGYVRNLLWNASLAAFCEMQFAGLIPDAVSIVSILTACSELKAVLLGKSAHAFSIRKGFDSNLSVSNALLAFYSDCNRLNSAFELFPRMDSRNVVSWNTLISGCVHGGERERAIDLLHQMKEEGVALDLVTLISVLPIYCHSEHLCYGIAFHGYAIKSGFASDVSLVNALISMYCKCGDLNAGKSLFKAMPERCVVSWNALMTGFRYHDLQDEVLFLFRQMVREDQRPNSVTLLNLLPACCNQLQGMSIHAFAIRTGALHETPLLTSLLCMYARFENLGLCLLLFEIGEKKDISLWNAIISVLVQTVNSEKAVAFFLDLLQIGLQPDTITVLNLISACAQLSSLNLADSVMSYVMRKGFDKATIIGNRLMDLYSKCGDVSTARRIFDSLVEKDALSWSVMINGYGLHGDGGSAFDLFLQMQFSGARPDDLACLGALSACAHAGLVEQGWMVFNSMSEHGISPRMEHYACMVDLLGRTGHLNEAYDVVKKLPCKPSNSLLESLLGACRIHGNVELGEKIGMMLIEMDPENSGSYVMLSSIYAAAGRWADANRVRSNIQGRRLRKEPGFSLLMSDGTS